MHVNTIASQYFRSVIEQNFKGVAHKGLNLSISRSIPIPIPPKNEQQRIISKVDELMAMFDALKERIAEVQIVKSTSPISLSNRL